MNAYIYAADIWCEDCGEAIREKITQEGNAPKNSKDERPYDSDEYPKGPYTDGGGESDTPEHCAAGAECSNAIKLLDGTKVGAWLENELTTEGVKYVREAIQEGGEVAELWAEFYCDYDLQQGEGVAMRELHHLPYFASNGAIIESRIDRDRLIILGTITPYRVELDRDCTNVDGDWCVDMSPTTPLDSETITQLKQEARDAVEEWHSKATNKGE